MQTYMLAIPIFVVVVAVGFLAWRWFKTSQLADRRPVDDKAWATAIAQQESQVTQMLLSVSKPLATLPTIKDLSGSDEFERLQEKLFAGGNTFGGSLEVYLAFQCFTAMIGSCIALLGSLGDISGLWRFILIAFGGALIFYPYDMVNRRAKERAKAVDSSLPEFAQFLIMAVGAGRNIHQALEFTAARVEGPVSEEMKNLLVVLQSKKMPTEDAFMMSAYNLGTPLSYQFVIALMKSSQEGKRITETLKAQADAVRNAVYQRRRSDAKKLPNKLVILFFLHMLPMMFIVSLMPGIYSFTQL